MTRTEINRISKARDREDWRAVDEIVQRAEVRSLCRKAARMRKQFERFALAHPANNTHVVTMSDYWQASAPKGFDR